MLTARLQETIGSLFFGALHWEALDKSDGLHIPLQKSVACPLSFDDGSIQAPELSGDCKKLLPALVLYKEHRRRIIVANYSHYLASFLCVFLSGFLLLDFLDF